MSTIQKIAVTILVLVLINFMLVIVFGDKGLVDLYHMKKAQEEIEAKNKELIKENLDNARKVDRLQKGDPELIEHQAREQLGLVKPGEIVVKVPNETGKP